MDARETLVVTVDEQGRRTVRREYALDECDYAGDQIYRLAMRLERAGDHAGAQVLLRKAQRAYARVGLGHMLEWAIEQK